jgi:hypothetical protein
VSKYRTIVADRLGYVGKRVIRACGVTDMSKGRDYMAVCGDCMQLIDLNKILPLIRRGLRVTHECGKVLHAGSTKS